MLLITGPRKKGRNGETMIRGLTEKKNKRKKLFGVCICFFNSDITAVFP
jgi:hypothetical protein